MPLYDFYCFACDKTYPLNLKMSDLDCPVICKCGAPMLREYNFNGLAAPQPKHG